MARKHKLIFVFIFLVLFLCMLFVDAGAKPYFTNKYKMSPSVFSVYIPDTNTYYSPSLILPVGITSFNPVRLPFSTDDDSQTTARFDGIFSIGGLYSDDVEIAFYDVDNAGSGALTLTLSGDIFIYSPSTNYLVVEDHVHFDASEVVNLFGFADTEYSIFSYFYNDMFETAQQMIEISDSMCMLFVGTVTVTGETGGRVDMQINAGNPRVDENGNLPIQNYQYNNIIHGTDLYIYSSGAYTPYDITVDNDIILRDVIVDINDVNDTLSLQVIYNNVSAFLNTPFFGIFTFGEVGAFILSLSVLMVILKFAYGG